MRASSEVLDALARALQMGPVERQHLLLLGRGEDAPDSAPPVETVSPTLRRLIENLGPNPAYVLGRRWDYLAWNRAAAAVLGDFDAMAPEARNHLWQQFTDPTRRELMDDWEQSARICVAKFRADHARHIGDPAFETLIASLREVSRDFCKAWRRHEVANTGAGRKTFHHPVAGELRFEHAGFHPVDDPEQRLILYTPIPDTGTAEKLEELCAAGRAAAADRELELVGAAGR